MKNIIFVCHGNICRSPAAEWIMKHLLTKYEMQDRFSVTSRATSREEIGNDIYPPMRRELLSRDIYFEHHCATQITQKDYDWADYIFYMDNNNLRYLNYLLKDKDNKFHLISEYTKDIDFIDDPWYSDKFEEVVDQLIICCDDIIKKLK